MAVLVRRGLGSASGTTSAGWLMAAIEEDDQRPYWDSWVVALDAFVTEWGAVATGS